MAETPRYRKQVTQLSAPRQIGSGSQGVAGLLASAQSKMSLAQKLDSFSNQLQGMAGQALQTEASKNAVRDIYSRKQKISEINSNENLTSEERVEQVGKIAEGTERAFSGVYSRAYNTTANAAYSTQIQADARQASYDAEIKAGGDSEVFAKQMKEFRDGTIPNAPTPETSIVAEMAIAQYGSAGYKKLKLAEIRKDEIKRHTQSNDTLSIQSDDTVNNLQEGDFTNAVINLQKQQVTLQDAVKNGWQTEESAQAIMDKTTENGILSYAKDRFNRGELIDGQEFIDNFRNGSADGEIPTEFFDVDRDKVADRMEYLLETEQKRANLKTKADAEFSKEQANIIVGDGIKVFNAFKMPDNANDIEQALPFASLAKQHEYNVQLEAYDMVRPYLNLSLPEQQSVINSKVANKTMSRTEVEALAMVKKNLSARVKKAKEDPMGLSFEEGMNTQQTSLAPTADLDEQAQGLQARAYMQTKNKQEYGEGATGLFTKTEVTQYSQWLESPDTSIAEKLDFFEMLEGTIPNKSNSAYNQLMKKGASVSAFAGSFLKEGKRDVAEKVLKGQLVLKALDKPEEIGEMRAKILKQLGNATFNMGKAETGSALGAILDTGLALYGAELQEQGRFDKGASSSQMKKIITELTNGVVKRNEQSFFLPAGVDEDDFNDWVDDLEVGDVPSAMGMTEEQTIRFIQDNKINSYGQNKYTIYQGKSQLKNLDGTPYTISHP